jgi:hypothetical protein
MNDPIIENFRDLMPEHIRQQWSEEDKREAKLIEDMRQACCNAIELIAEAMRRPKVSRVELEDAQKYLMRALSIAATLDPE